jgi:acetolactate synthase-1/2/3 large subunit
MKNPDFVDLARAMNVYSLRCETAADLPVKMAEFLAYDNAKPVLMECLVDRAEHVFPTVRWHIVLVFLLLSERLVWQVPPGKGLHEQVLHSLLREA